MRSTILIAAIAALSVSGCKTASKTEAVKRPNILLIVADDLGFSDIGAYGGEIATPALDELAKEGVQLSNFHVLPTCSPTRSVLLSGMDNHRAGLGTMGEFVTPEMEGHPGYAGYLNFEVAALPEVMQRAGYHTYMAGKWHLGAEERTSPHARGFEETFVLLQGGGSHWADRKPLCPPETMVYQRNGKEVESLPEDFYSSRYYTDRMLEWIEQGRADGRPFFGYLAYTAPHDPLRAPAKYTAKYRGEYDNTMILFMSDNGANGALPTAYPGQTEEHLASFDDSLENRGLPGSYIETGPGWAQASMSPSRMFKAYPTQGGHQGAALGEASRQAGGARCAQPLVRARS